MAYNDAVLSTEDWQALSSMHDSSKTEDESLVELLVFSSVIDEFQENRQIWCGISIRLQRK